MQELIVSNHQEAGVLLHTGGFLRIEMLEAGRRWVLIRRAC